MLIVIVWFHRRKMGARKIFRRIITTKTRQIKLLKNAMDTIEQNVSEKLNKAQAIKLNKLQANKRKLARNHIAFINNFKIYLNNLPTPSL